LTTATEAKIKSTGAGKYLTFSLDREEYGIGILKIKEIIVDSVSEVINIKDFDIEPPPACGAKLDTISILGMAKLEGGIKILLDIDKGLYSEELVLL